MISNESIKGQLRVHSCNKKIIIEKVHGDLYTINERTFQTSRYFNVRASSEKQALELYNNGSAIFVKSINWK